MHGRLPAPATHRQHPLIRCHVTHQRLGSKNLTREAQHCWLGRLPKRVVSLLTVVIIPHPHGRGRAPPPLIEIRTAL
eukprot:314476-Pleurochrysis_carterae.AAC.1